MTKLAVIPARYASTRFPGKLLRQIGGKSILQRTCEQVVLAGVFDKVVVSTPDDVIDDAVVKMSKGLLEGVGVQRVPHCDCGFESAAIAASRLPGYNTTTVIYGDEPLLPLELIRSIMQASQSSPGFDIVVGRRPLKSAKEYFSPNCVKVVASPGGRAIYFSRAPVPGIKGRLIDESNFEQYPFYKRVGPHVFRHDMLLKWLKWKDSPSVLLEDLELVIFLEHGVRIFAEVTNLDSPDISTAIDFTNIKNIIEGSGRGNIGVGTDVQP